MENRVETEDREEGLGIEEYDHEVDPDIIYLYFDDDVEVECVVLGVFEVEDKEYIALLPESEEEILLYEYRENSEDFELIPIKDEEELQSVYEAYYVLFEEEADELDEEDDLDIE